MIKPRWPRRRSGGALHARLTAAKVRRDGLWSRYHVLTLANCPWLAPEVGPSLHTLDVSAAILSGPERPLSCQSVFEPDL